MPSAKQCRNWQFPYFPIGLPGVQVSVCGEWRVRSYLLRKYLEIFGAENGTLMYTP